jgi:hypothetical protein
MFDLFKQNNTEATQDVKTLRQRILQYIKEQLQRWEGGEGNNIKGMQLFVAVADTERGLYEGALYYHDKDMFQEEIQRIADDYSVDIPDVWTLEISFVDELPKETVKSSDLPLSLYVATKKQPVLSKATTAYIKVLSGEAEKADYTITATGGKVCIGREKKAQTSDGFFRVNDIAFPGEKHESNKYISRNHAHIEWNKETGGFFLYADAGGLPPRNKIKVRTGKGDLIKLQTPEIGHQLEEGDQIVLGESVVLQFTYLND